MDGTWDDILVIVTWSYQVEIGSSWADQMEEGEAMYERDRPTQKVFFTVKLKRNFAKHFILDFASFQIVLPTAPSATFGPDIDDDK